MFTIRFEEEASLDPGLVGGKALGLAQMIQNGLPVAPGFTVSTRAYRKYLAETGLRDRIAWLLQDVDHGSIGGLETAEQQIAAWFAEGAFPADIRAEVAAGYDQLCATTVPEVSVAVRSSATAEDAAGASFAGEYDTFVGMRGAAEVEAYVRRCWASAFTARSMHYAWNKTISPLEVEMAVVVQKTVNARAAGVMFTLSPLTGDRSRIAIEAAYGLGLGVVGGEVTPDRYAVSKIGLRILDRTLGDKHLEYIDGETATPVAPERRHVFCLSDDEVTELARLGKVLERQHRHPVDVEFAIDRDMPDGQTLVLLQCRPETYWSARHAAAKPAPLTDPAKAVLGNVLRSKRSG